MYTLVPARADAQTLLHYAELLGGVFGQNERFSVAYLQWLYAENPAGLVLGTDAYTDDGTLAAHYATIPVWYSRGGQPVKALLSLNTATHPTHQGKGLFTQLATATYAAAAEAGYGFVIGVANQNSTPGFIRKLGFTQLGSLKAVLTLSPPTLLPVEDVGLVRQYSPEALAWRLHNPNVPYFRYGSHVFASTSVPGLAAQLTQRGFDLPPLAPKPPITRLWIGNAPGIRFGWPSVPLPSWLKPSPLHLIYLPLDSEPAPISDDLLFEALDFDAF